jgi:hypothetical protein
MGLFKSLVGTIEDLQVQYYKLKPKGSFFDPDTMAYFDSRLHRQTFSPTDTLTYFITSERFSPKSLVDSFMPKTIEELGTATGAWGGIMAELIKRDNPKLKKGKREFVIRSFDQTTGDIENQEELGTFKDISAALVGVRDLLYLHNTNKIS